MPAVASLRRIRFLLTRLGATALAMTTAGCQFFFPMPLDPTLEPTAMANAPVVQSSGTPFEEGEVFEAQVFIEGVSAGKARFAVGKKCLVDNKVALPIKTSGEVGGLLAFLSDGNAETFALVDAQTGLTLESHWDVTIDKKRTVSELDYGPGIYRIHQTRYEVSLDKMKKGSDSFKRTLLKTKQTPHDGHSLLGYLRRWNAPEGSNGYAYVLMGRHLVRADVMQGGVEDIRVGSASYSALRIDGVATRIEERTLQQVKRTTPKPFTLWFSNDEERRPLRIEVETELARLMIDITAVKHEQVPSGPPAACTERIDKAALDKSRQPRRRNPNRKAKTGSPVGDRAGVTTEADPAKERSALPAVTPKK